MFLSREDTLYVPKSLQNNNSAALPGRVWVFLDEAWVRRYMHVMPTHAWFSSSLSGKPVAVVSMITRNGVPLRIGFDADHGCPERRLKQSPQVRAFQLLAEDGSQLRLIADTAETKATIVETLGSVVRVIVERKPDAFADFHGWLGVAFDGGAVRHLFAQLRAGVLLFFTSASDQTSSSWFTARQFESYVDLALVLGVSRSMENGSVLFIHLEQDHMITLRIGDEYSWERLLVEAASLAGDIVSQRYILLFFASIYMQK